MAAPGRHDIFGPYRGGRYTRTYVTTFWLLATGAFLLEFGVRGRWAAMVVAGVLGFIGAVAIVGVAQSVLTTDGLRLVLLRRWLPWADVAAVVAPEAGDTELRLGLHDGTVVTAKGVPPDVGPALTRYLRTRTVEPY